MAAEVDVIEALVLSKETVQGGELINQQRKENGFEPLALIVIDLVGEAGGYKLSSTALRQAEAERQEQK
jgi:pantetheine-phosphate adenylyltransferase